MRWIFADWVRLNGKYEVQGAEEPETFLQVFDEIKSNTRIHGMTGGDNTC